MKIHYHQEVTVQIVITPLLSSMFKLVLETLDMVKQIQLQQHHLIVQKPKAALSDMNAP